MESDLYGGWRWWTSGISIAATLMVPNGRRPSEVRQEGGAPRLARSSAFSFFDFVPGSGHGQTANRLDQFQDFHHPIYARRTHLSACRNKSRLEGPR